MQPQSKEEYIAFLDKRIAFLESELKERSQRLANLDRLLTEYNKWMSRFTTLMLEKGWNLSQIAKIFDSDPSEIERLTKNNKE